MRKPRIVFATLAVGLIMILGTAGTALASTSASSDRNAVHAANAAAFRQVPAAKSECAQYSLCLWKNKDYGDPFNPFYYFAEPHDQWLDLGDNLSNTTSSLYNYRDGITWVAQFAGGSGLRACIPGGRSFDNLADYNWPKSTTTANDSITSYDFYSSGTCPLDYLFQAKS